MQYFENSNASGEGPGCAGDVQLPVQAQYGRFLQSTDDSGDAIFTQAITNYRVNRNAGISGVSFRLRVQCTKKHGASFLVHCTLDLLLTPLISAV
jgi:hypothetical protein